MADPIFQRDVGLLRVPAPAVAARAGLDPRHPRAGPRPDGAGLLPGARPGADVARSGDHRPRPRPPARLAARFCSSRRRSISGSTATTSCTRRGAPCSARPTPTSTRPCRPSGAGRPRRRSARLTALVQVFRRSTRPVLAGLVVLAVGWIGGLWAFPTLVQRLRVAPNELVAERPYIAHNIRLTRRAYALDRIEERDFPAEENLTAADLAGTTRPSRTSGSGTTRPLLPPSPSSRRSAPTTGSSTWTTTATSSTASTGR